MKVLELGRKQRGWAKEYRCSGDGYKGGGCSALLLVEFDDLFRTVDDDGTKLAFQCSECKVMTRINLTEPPDFDKIPDYKVWKSTNDSKILHG